MALIELPDVNVLIALFDPEHMHHDAAQNWFTVASEQGWATCPLTENGFLRIVTKPNYPNVRWSVVEATTRLTALMASSPNSHRFYPDSVSLCDSALFKREAVQGTNQLTDLYLLGLCPRHDATLVTFDGGMRETVRAVVGANAALMRLLMA